MKRFLIIATLVALLCPALGAKTLSLSGFSEIVSYSEAASTIKSFIRSSSSLSGQFRVTVIPSSRYSVEVEYSDPNYSENAFEIKVSGDKLMLVRKVFALKKERNGCQTSPLALVKVYMPRLKALKLSGADQLRFEGEFAEGFESVELSGATEVSGFKTKKGASSSEIIVSGSSKVSGFAFESSALKLDTSGASEIKELDAKVTGGSAAIVRVSGSSRMSGDIECGEGVVCDVELSGASEVTYDLSSDKIKITLSGSSEGTFGISSTKKSSESSCRVTASGASTVKLSGEGRKSATFIASGSSRIKASEFKCEGVVANASGASSVAVWASESLDCDISIASKLDYYGSPKRIIDRRSNVRAH